MSPGPADFTFEQDLASAATIPSTRYRDPGVLALEPNSPGVAEEFARSFAFGDQVRQEGAPRRGIPFRVTPRLPKGSLGPRALGMTLDRPARGERRRRDRS